MADDTTFGPVALGSAVVSTAVFGVSPKTLPSFGPAPKSVGRIIVRLAGETPTRATGTVALPDPSESFRQGEKARMRASQRARRGKLMNKLCCISI
jgi:hypothetical protein